MLIPSTKYMPQAAIDLNSTSVKSAIYITHNGAQFHHVEKDSMLAGSSCQHLDTVIRNGLGSLYTHTALMCLLVQALVATSRT